MTSIRAIVRDRRIELTVPDDIPDGAEVLVDLTPVAPAKIGLSEAEWRDDADALADWAAWLETIEPVAFAADDAFAEEFRRFNIKAVRKQMQQEGVGPVVKQGQPQVDIFGRYDGAAR
ncbi:MAG: hypothetical protein ACYC3I_16090 [Gemmataceae bacterium]